MSFFEYLPSCLSLETVPCTVVDRSSVAGRCPMELAVVYHSRLCFSMELTAWEGQCLSLMWSRPPDRELFASRLVRSLTCVPLMQTAPCQCSVRTCIMLFCFRSIPVSLNAIHRFQLHRNGIHFHLHRTERNGNVTVFMAHTVYNSYT